MSIKVRIPGNFIPERKYAIDMVFSNFLGLKYELEIGPDIVDYYICIGNKHLIVKDCFFSHFNDENGYLDAKNVPQICLFFTDVKWIIEKNLPVIFGRPELDILENGVECKFDIFATIFFFLSRWEEVVNKVKDEHLRFPASASLSGRFELIDRPVVDEYVMFLKEILQALGVEGFKHSDFQVNVSCDVDWPFDPIYYNSFKMLKTLGGDAIKRRSFKEFAKHVNNQFAVIRHGFKHDPYNTFDFLMDCCEKCGRTTAFYFISGHSAGEIDGVYDLDMPMVRNLLTTIDQRGHEIGIHFSYNAYKEMEVMKVELENLRRVLSDLALSNTVEGGRQHFLRWETPITPRIWNDLGLIYDSTLGYADHVGFRSGTSHSYPIFDLIERKQLALLEKPLILMECSAISERYMGMGYTSDALQYMLNIKEKVRKVKGTFTVLWHNSHFNNPIDFVFFEELVK